MKKTHVKISRELGYGLNFFLDNRKLPENCNIDNFRDEIGDNRTILSIIIVCYCIFHRDMKKIVISTIDHVDQDNMENTLRTLIDKSYLNYTLYTYEDDNYDKVIRLTKGDNDFHFITYQNLIIVDEVDMFMMKMNQEVIYGQSFFYDNLRIRMNEAYQNKEKKPYLVIL